MNIKVRYFVAALIGFLVGVGITGILAILQFHGVIDLADREWSIGIYRSSSSAPLSFSDKDVRNPVLTANDVSDVSARFVADPFLFPDNNTWFMFFEVLDDATGLADIGLAVSDNGLDWVYCQVVLDEPFGLSYPYVFKDENEYYMIPETSAVGSVRLYKANNFPYAWSFVKTLIRGRARFADPSILHYGDMWYIFVETGRNDTLRLYYSKELTGPWAEHPESPIIKGDANIARPGGKVTIFDGRIIRFAQDDDLTYGNQVWAFEITKLTPEIYEEHIVDKNPIIKGDGSGWNAHGMHQLVPCQVSDNGWIASVDGYRQGWGRRLFTLLVKIGEKILGL